MKNISVVRAALLGAAGGLALASHAPIFAAEPSDDSVEALRRELRALKEEQARNLAALEQANARINALETRLGTVPEVPSNASASSASTVMPPAPSWGSTGQPMSGGNSGLDIVGDLRLRYEDNAGEAGVRGRGRYSLRARLRASYAINDWLTVGGQLATGDPDDPNSVDVTLSNFDDDFDVSIDQAYLKIDTRGFTALVGRFSNPFERSDLVWDGDVSPQGVSASHEADLGKNLSVRTTGLFFVVDESVGGPDSYMGGGQLLLSARLSSAVKLSLAGAYYDYSLRSLSGGDSSDFRGNLLGTDGRYLSDFNLIDAIAALALPGFGERWPIRLNAEYVKNVGAATQADTGYTAGLTVGRSSKAHDLRFAYNYMVAETEAVLAAFSHDNLALATNYVAHTLTIDYMLWKNVVLNATYNHYRPKDGPAALTRDWRSRLRLYVMVSF